MSEREGLSEDDGVFEDSDGERLDYSGESESDGSVEGSSSEEEAVATDEEDMPKRKKKISKKEERRKERSKKRSKFVEMEAAVGDDDEEEDEGDYDDEEDEEDEDGFVDNEIEEREKEFSAAFERRLAAHAARRDAMRKELESKWDPEAEESRLKELYGKGGREQFYGDRGSNRSDLSATASTLAQVLQPKATDPKLWLVKCRPGRERAAVASLMHGLTILGDSMGIFSVIGRDSLKGYIYVEAHKMNDVINAVQKTKTNHVIFASPMNKPVLVPLNEMVDVLTAGISSSKSSSESAPDPESLKIGGWVRVKRGKYSGDLAQIIEVEQEQVSDGNLDYILRVKLLPRLSYRSGRGSQKDRPSARPFDPQEASQYGAVTKARGFWLFNGEAYKDGFLYKDVRLNALSFGSIIPRNDELENFGALSLDDSSNKDRQSVDIPVLKTSLMKGERVRVIKGEFQNMTGTVDSTPSGEMISIRFDNEELFKEPVFLRLKHVDRDLQVGNMVVVGAGEHVGKSAMIVSIEGRNAVLFSLLDQLQFTAPLTILNLATADSSMDKSKSGKPTKASSLEKSLELNDLVTVEGEDGEAAVILKLLDDDHASILDSSGQTRKLPFKRLQKITSINFGGWNNHRSFVKGADPAAIYRSGDRVEFTDTGNSQRRPATVLHIHKNSAFLRTIDSGEVISRPVNILTTPTSLLSEPSLKMRPSGRPSAGGPVRHLIGKTITIGGAGPYKGYVGIIRDIDDIQARVELHTNCKVVSVPRERVMTEADLAKARSSSVVTSSSYGSSKTSTWSDSKTPAWGSSSSAKTPAWGSSSSAKTPAWGSSSSAKTPAWGSSSSAKTPAWGSSSSAKTPAWGSSSSAKTPAWGSSNKTPAWGGSARTPARNEGGSKTPSWSTTNLNQPTSSSASSTVNWAFPNVEVSRKSDGSVVGKITSIQGNRVSIAGQSGTIDLSDLRPSAPGKKDFVRLLGEDQASGTVIGLDGPDAVIRVDNTGDFRIVPVNGLVKIVR